MIDVIGVDVIGITTQASFSVTITESPTSFRITPYPPHL